VVRRAEIGPYRILRLLKEGGGGKVYVALDQRLNRRVALKFISVPAEREARDLIVAEARALARLNHRCIVQIFDVVEVQDFIILVMEYVSGTDLEDLCKQVQLDQLAALQLALDLGAALAAAHHSGIVHRDLKPGNVLLAPDGHIKLADFGIASISCSASEAPEPSLDQPIPGSYLSISPEQGRGEPVDQRSDLFALGLLIYRALAGRHPFAGPNGSLLDVQQIYSAQGTSISELVPDILPRFSALVDSLLQRDARNRPRSALVVRQEALAILRELPLTRGKPLARFMPGTARSEDAIETTLDLPANLGRGARSHLLSAGEWGPWASSALLFGRRSALLFLSLSALILSILGLDAWLESRQITVNLRRPEVLLEAMGSLAPEANQLRELLERAVDQQDNVILNKGLDGDALEMKVSCNEYICGLLLRRHGSEETFSSYRSLLPGAPHAAWQASIQGSLAELFEQE
jgi:serine/threonine protein kinase